MPTNDIITPETHRLDSDLSARLDGRPLIVFDGDCVMCSAQAQFVLRHGRALLRRAAWSHTARTRSRQRAEWEEDGSFHFDVPIALPLIGLVVHYRGWLERVSK